LETLALDLIKKSRFLVTGGAGFIGSNLCEYLVTNYAKKVICLDNLFNGKKDNINHLFNKDNFEFILGDITNKELLIKLTSNIDYILHQAAWGSVPRSMKMPIEYNQNNVTGTLNIFEAARVNKVIKVVYASSSSVYGDHPILPKVEGIEGNILSPYALTKKINEFHAKLYWEVFKLPTVGLRYFNVFGRRQNPEGEYAAVIPRFIKKVINNESPVVFGDGDQSRDFTYIDNVIHANINACFFSNEEAYGKSFNIAFGEKITINELFITINKYLNKKVKISFTHQRLGDIKHSLADISNAKRAFNFNPKVDFKAGLKLSIDWYKKNS
jgi:UDP-N-acetylglucosamine/UDP-N-acetylgalactosamine 4-epimerase